MKLRNRLIRRSRMFIADVSVRRLRLASEGWIFTVCVNIPWSYRLDPGYDEAVRELVSTASGSIADETRYLERTSGIALQNNVAVDVLANGMLFEDSVEIKCVAMPIDRTRTGNRKEVFKIAAEFGLRLAEVRDDAHRFAAA